MFHLKDFLQKFSLLSPPDRLVREASIAVVGEAIGITLSQKDIEIRGGVLFLNIHPVAKSELLLKKSLVLDEIARRMAPQKKEIRDIR